MIGLSFSCENLPDLTPTRGYSESGLTPTRGLLYVETPFVGGLGGGSGVRVGSRVTTMHRFFVTPELLAPVQALTDSTPEPGRELHITLPEKLAHQVRDVLHLGIGEQLALLDNGGSETLASVVKSNRSMVEVQVIERRPGKDEPPVRIILCQGLLKSARFEWILEKGTELGVSVFVPTLCRRSMAGLEETGSAKVQRWKRIIQEAAEQCDRSRLPELSPIRPLLHALNDIPKGALALMPWEEERELSLYTALNSVTDVKQVKQPLEEAQGQERQVTTVVLFIGPEGGLIAEEVALARRYGVQIVTLGERILRAETAALATIANVVYEFGG
jgi:16S rRNA (uracil1498-N3)-methyltransferase